ncbi:hypothetical protein N5079_08870 [Planotetraspora sp. A-T 1434]|uniref:hypothetical protein n=1 Tax=Planotetraspora sp. A-T 1434 TaxID=2979219 RepID=UPI0021BE3FD1|nr:hypothetical protein [Planotetraspora sp. A-T 1434]MCT9930336.1 hypothetical protein [Planotetraspora sp. A-T 1434]
MIAVVVLLFGASASFAMPAVRRPPLGADGCPTAWVEERDVFDLPGPLVPDGAVSVTLCELVTRLPYRGRPARSPWSGQARTLTTRVADMVTVLNALPTRDELEARIRARSKAEGRPLPEDVHVGTGCTDIGFPSELSFAVHYVEGPPAVVLLDRNCGTARFGARTRYLNFSDGKPIDTFLGFYRDQLASRGFVVAAPACPAVLRVRRSNEDVITDVPRDDIARNRGGSAAHLPSPLAAVTACRYVRQGDTLRLGHSRTLRDELGPIRDLLNTATAIEEVRKGGGTEVVNWTRCGVAGSTADPVKRLDVVWVADVTGAVAEIRVWRAPCAAVFPGMGGVVAKPALLVRLDDWLRG